MVYCAVRNIYLNSRRRSRKRRRTTTTTTTRIYKGRKVSTTGVKETYNLKDEKIIKDERRKEII